MRILPLTLLLIACSGSTKPISGPALEPPVEEAPEGANEDDQAAPPATDDCLESCMKRNMARAESAETIEADCKQECSQSTAVAERAADLALQSGRMVVIKGQLKRASGGFVLHLADGHEVQVKAQSALDLEPAVGGEALVSGRYEETESGRMLLEAKLATHMR